MTIRPSLSGADEHPRSMLGDEPRAPKVDGHQSVPRFEVEFPELLPTDGLGETGVVDQPPQRGTDPLHPTLHRALTGNVKDEAVHVTAARFVYHRIDSSSDPILTDVRNDHRGARASAVTSDGKPEAPPSAGNEHPTACEVDHVQTRVTPAIAEVSGYVGNSGFAAPMITQQSASVSPTLASCGERQQAP